MRLLFILLVVSWGFRASAQSVEVQFLNDEDYKILLQSGWTLEYQNQQVPISKFELLNNRFVILSYKDEAYDVYLINERNTIEDVRKNIPLQSIWKYSPSISVIEDFISIGPSKNKFVEISSGDNKIRRRKPPVSVVKNTDIVYSFLRNYYELEKRKAMVYKKNVFVKKDRQQENVLLGEVGEKIDTLWRQSFEAERLTIDNVIPSLQWQLDESGVFILDNKLGVLAYKDTESKDDVIKLEAFGFDRSRALKSYPIYLLKDQVSKEVYLLYCPINSRMEAKFFSIEKSMEDKLVLTNIAISTDRLSASTRIHDGRLYELFKIEKLEALGIYSFALPD